MDWEWGFALRKEIKANGQVEDSFLLLLPPERKYRYYFYLIVFSFLFSSHRPQKKNNNNSSSLYYKSVPTARESDKTKVYDRFIHKRFTFQWSLLFFEMPISQETLAAL